MLKKKFIRREIAWNLMQLENARNQLFEQKKILIFHYEKGLKFLFRNFKFIALIFQLISIFGGLKLCNKFPNN